MPFNRNAIEELYQRHCTRGAAISAHLSRLRHLAEGCELAVEFGVKRGFSTTALLLAAQHVLSVDLVSHAELRVLRRYADESHWIFLQGDTRLIDIPECDLLFVDADHSYVSVNAELQRHADKVRQWLVFHDTITFGSIAADGETGKHRWQHVLGLSVPPEFLGIRPAIDELMIRDPSWRIHAHHTDSHGLLVLKRHGA
ncbi:MAG TPA: class I SAM-dependent methyltransferase [Mycobacterium sp.]|nr:class I SAM-dependent methyltransferase [Mycobacterium sp.]